MLDRFSRRELLLSVPALPAMAQTTAPRPAAAPKPDLVPLNRLPRMVQEYFTIQVRRAGQSSIRALDRLKTKADAEAHVTDLRARNPARFRSDAGEDAAQPAHNWGG